MDIIEYGLYNIKDKYFSDFKNNFFVDNKCENRPHYCTFTDKKGTIWFIPLSTQTEPYKKKIEKDEKKHGDCLFYHIGTISGIERVFLIGNMFPVTKEYIKKPYTINNIHYIVCNKNLIRQIHKKASKYLLLVEQGKLSPNVDILSIKEYLHNKK